MKIALPKEEEGFVLKDAVIAGDKVTLVYPEHIGCKWTKDNLIFRASIWDSEGRPVSLGFRKFFNYTEHPEIAGDPRDLKKISIIEKIDGSCLIISKYKGQVIARTRQQFDATAMNNGYEIAVLKAKYPAAFDPAQLQEDRSYLYEWVSPDNRIVIDYGAHPELYLLNIVSHDDYSYTKQVELDQYAHKIAVPRPQHYSFNHVDDALKAVEAFNGKEGVCFYFDNDQEIKKVKSLWYLSLHRFKSECNLENILDNYLACGRPVYTVFMESLERSFDHECMVMARPFASKICDAYKEVEQIVDHMHKFVEPLKALNVKHGFKEGRKRAAQEIGKAYGQTNRASFAFAILDGKALDDEAIKKLLFQVMKA